MLVHQHQESEASGGDPGPSVKLSDRTVDNFGISGTVHSGIRTVSGGVLFTFQPNGGTSSVSGEWLVSGPSSDFYIQRTIISGTLEVDPGAGFLQMNATRSYDNQKSSIGVKTTEVFFEISDDVSGVPVVETATMTFVSERESGA